MIRTNLPRPEPSVAKGSRRETFKFLDFARDDRDWIAAGGTRWVASQRLGHDGQFPSSLRRNRHAQKRRVFPTRMDPSIL
jgi:hypothetical protein